MDGLPCRIYSYLYCIVITFSFTAARKQDVGASSSSESTTTSPSQSLPSQSPEQVPLAKRLRRSTIDPATPLTSQKKVSAALHSSLPSTSPRKSPASESSSLNSQETPKQNSVVSRSSSRSEQKQVAASCEPENTAADRSSSSVYIKSTNSTHTVSYQQQQKSQSAPFVQLTQLSLSAHSKKANIALSSLSLSPASAAGKRTGSTKEEKSKENAPSKDASSAISPDTSVARTNETEYVLHLMLIFYHWGLWLRMQVTTLLYINKFCWFQPALSECQLKKSLLTPPFCLVFRIYWRMISRHNFLLRMCMYFN